MVVRLTHLLLEIFALFLVISELVFDLLLEAFCERLLLLQDDFVLNLVRFPQIGYIIVNLVRVELLLGHPLLPLFLQSIEHVWRPHELSILLQRIVGSRVIF